MNHPDPGLEHMRDRAFLYVVARASFTELVEISSTLQQRDEWKRVAVARAIRRLVRAEVIHLVEGRLA